MFPHLFPVVGVPCPTDHDVLSGRGCIINSHPGNAFFRELVKSNKERYVMSDRSEKRAIAQSIIETVRFSNPPRRFLEKNPETGMWNDIGDAKALEKVTQALRHGAAAVKENLLANLDKPKGSPKASLGRNDARPLSSKREKKQGACGGRPSSLARQISFDLGAADFLDTDAAMLALLSSEILKPTEEKTSETGEQKETVAALRHETVGLPRHPSFDWGDLDVFFEKGEHSHLSSENPETGFSSEIQALSEGDMMTQSSFPFDDPEFLDTIFDMDRHAPTRKPRKVKHPVKVRRNAKPTIAKGLFKKSRFSEVRMTSMPKAA